MNERIKVIIADDMKPILDYLVSTLSNDPRFEIVYKAQDGEQLIEATVRLMPDIVITDVEMPKFTGIQAIEEINKRISKTPKYVIITGYNSGKLVEDTNRLNIDLIVYKPITDEKRFIEQLLSVVDEEPLDKEEIVIKYVKDTSPIKSFFKKLFNLE